MSGKFKQVIANDGTLCALKATHAPERTVFEALVQTYEKEAETLRQLGREAMVFVRNDKVFLMTDWLEEA